MVTFTAAFGLALLCALLMTPLMGVVARRLGAVSRGGDRHVGSAAVPRLGGIAIACATLLPIIGLFFVKSEVARLVRQNESVVLGLVAGSILSCAVGAVDDLRALSAWTKFGAQLGCALLAYFLGFRILVLEVPFVGLIDTQVISLPLTLLWIVGITNAINLIDGLDGLAAGVVFCAAATNLIVAAIGGHALVAVLMAALMGAVLGFLVFNFNPASIFMGDSGSYFSGFVLATASLAGSQKASTAVALLVPVLALGLPIFDTLFSVVRRALERRPLFSPDRGHIHHRLLDLGLTHRRAVLLLYFSSGLLAVSALLLSIDRDWTTGAALLLASTVVFGLIRVAGTMAKRHRLPPAADETLRGK